ncbi:MULTISPECIES: putative 2OG-Fe(II) oxygenase [Pseudanabaena]|uniref:putative 2OG-Fe(II) oxygenase n=1 Tax=Pseudanabaena TaxID=1152 RepID=UPI00389A88BD
MLCSSRFYVYLCLATYKLRIGSMLLFPSWLGHGVETNMSEESRITIAFNIGMTTNTE